MSALIAQCNDGILMSCLFVLLSVFCNIDFGCVSSLFVCIQVSIFVMNGFDVEGFIEDRMDLAGLYDCLKIVR